MGRWTVTGRSRSWPASVVLLLAVVVAVMFLPGRAAAASFARSVNVALIPDDGSTSNGGTLPTGGTVAGRAYESFDQFNFTDLGIGAITPAALSQFDTVVLNQVNTSDLDGDARQALADFVTGGGKLVIHDADATSGNDYSWLPAPAQTGQSCVNCGNTNGTATVVESNSLVSSNPADPSYVDMSELPDRTDAIGDANVMVSQDSRWFKDVIATNGIGQTGAVDTYASVNGLMIYNGFDTDNVGNTEASGIDWLGHMWFRELAQPWNPDGLPHATPLNCSGTIGTVSPTSGTVPEAGAAGTTITITGQSLCPGTEVQFGNSSAVVPATVNGTTQLTATVPREGTSGGLQLIPPDGASAGPSVPFAVDSYRNTNGFQFINDAGVGKDFGFGDVAAAFGSNAYDTWTTCQGSCTTIKVPSDPAKQIEKIGASLNGLCFGFALGSLRISQGLDPRADNAPGRSDPAWNQPNTWDLPAYEGDAAPYGSQMRHYLYAQQIRQYSSQYSGGVSTYEKGLKTAPDKGAYVLAQVKSAIAAGKALIGLTYRYHDSSGLFSIFQGKNASEGHELVAFDVEAHGDGSFDVDVYDGNQPWSDGGQPWMKPSEMTNGSAHHAKLVHNQIHVQANGDWTYNGDFAPPAGANWTGGPNELQPVPFADVRGQLTPLASGSANNAVAMGAPIGQLTDASGRTLFDANGDVLPVDQGADAILIGAADTNSTTGGAAAPIVLLNPAVRYTEALGPGTQAVSAPGVAGQISSIHGGEAVLAPGAGTLAVTQAAPGAVNLSLSRDQHGIRTTVSIDGAAKGTLTLTDGRTVVVTSQAPQNVTLTVQQLGVGRPPTMFSGTVRLAAGQRLLLGGGTSLNPGVPTLGVTLVGKRGGRHSIRLRNHATRPTVAITRLTARRGRATTVTVRLSSGRATGGTLVLSVAAGRDSRTEEVVARHHATLIIALGRAARGAKLRIWAVVINRSGQASRTVTRTATLR